MIDEPSSKADLSGHEMTVLRWYRAWLRYIATKTDDPKWDEASGEYSRAQAELALLGMRLDEREKEAGQC